MLRFAVLAILFAAVCAVPINDESKMSEHNVIVVDSIDEYLQQNPKFELLEEFEREFIEDRQQIRYTLGNRVNGDRQVAANSFNQQWATPQDVNVRFNYPATGIGAITTFVQFIVEQSTNVGRVFIVAGGIGQRQVSVIIEARRTLFFRYNVLVFGIN